VGSVVRIEQDIDAEQWAPRDEVESSCSEASNTGKGGGAAETRKRKHMDDEASASDKNEGDDNDAEGRCSNSDSRGDDGGNDDSEGDDDDDDSEGCDGGNDDNKGDGNDNDDNDDMEEGDMRDAEVLTGVSFPCCNRGSKCDDLLITEIESLVTFFEDPDQNRCKVLTATASNFHRNRGGRFAEGEGSQTDPIKTIHLEPPVDQGDERPIDYRLELYVGRLKRSNMRAGRLFGVCQAIRDACKHNDDMDPKALTSLFRKTQKLSKRDPRLTLDVSNSSVVGTAYALPLLQHWYAASRTTRLKGSASSKDILLSRHAQRPNTSRSETPPSSYS